MSGFGACFEGTASVESERIGGRQWKGGRVIYWAGSKQGCVMAMSLYSFLGESIGYTGVYIYGNSTN